MKQLKAIILAASPGAEAGAPYPRLLQPLGDKMIIDYVVEMALRFVSPRDLYIVVGYERDKLEKRLGAKYQYVSQDQPLGTAHAVLQVHPLLQNYEGDLLILYGDTPLFRPASIRGLINRHRLKNAGLTLFTTTSEQTLPYGRIIRDSSGRIMDIIEQAEASAEVQKIRELNLGAYVFKASALFSVLRPETQPTSARGYPLTDCVHQLIRAGYHVESYQSYDQDEILGINTPADLKQAEFILQKRFYRPKRVEEENIVQFGTGGWRAVIGEGFTMHNVRRLCQALCNKIIREGSEARGVVIGYDRRFLADRAAEAAAEVFAGNNIPAILLSEDAPTPLITFAARAEDAVLGLAFTASHNPPEYNGLKVFLTDGALLMDEETREIETETNALREEEVVKIELEIAAEAGVVRRADYTNEYVDAVESFIDLDVIRRAGLRVILDPMYGVGQVTLEIILTEARCRVVTIHGRHDPLFGGRSPAPDLKALGLLIAELREGHYDLGLATDGDADRIAIIDERGEYIHINDILLLLYYYLHEVRGMKGGVVRNLATTHMLDRLARHFGEICEETPVGFKHIAAGMKRIDALLGGESSGGLTMRGHIMGKDGILAAVLVVEMLARMGKRLSEFLAEIHAITGHLYTIEENLPATSEMKVIIPERLRKMALDRLGPYAVLSVSHLDGIKILLENDNWVLLRFSGTEPLLRIFAEADSPEKGQELVQHVSKLVGLEAKP
jgi:phosphomannomutase/UTP-glucose-1-phosphate uridylyltransferase